MSISPARPVSPGTSPGDASQVADEAAGQGAADPHSIEQRVFGVNHFQQRQGPRAAQWFGSQHGAMPQVAMGMNDGPLVPPRGTFLLNRAGSVSQRAASVKNAAGRNARGAGRAGQSAHLDGGAEGEVEGSALGGPLTDASIPVSSESGEGMGSDAGAQHSAPMAVTEFLRARDASEALVQPGRTSGARATLASADVELSPQQALAQMRSGEVCWVTSLRLAMQCAQMHPGGDIFVQAFTVADAEGNIVPSFSKRVRLRADAAGAVVARAHDAADATDAASGGAAASPALLAELDAAPLLGLSMALVLDEAGEPMSALAGLQAAELEHVRRLFARPMPPAMLQALSAAQAGLLKIRRAVFDNPDFAERVGRHGDALERVLQQQRTGLSETIRGAGIDAHRARTNWQRAQAQVALWAQLERRPTFELVLQLNLLLGDGMKPWNRAEQADRVGARFGVLRHFDVVAGVPPQYFVRADQVPQAMVELFDWFESQRYAGEAVFTAAQFLQRLVSIHPFADANGRTARLVMDWLLQLQGWPPALLPAGEFALFAHQSTANNPAPGAAEGAVVEGLRLGLMEHVNWLQIDAAPG